MTPYRRTDRKVLLYCRATIRKPSRPTSIRPHPPSTRQPGPPLTTPFLPSVIYTLTQQIDMSFISLFVQGWFGGAGER